eukprot:symbB.v1.2.031879.t1/scaffold3745.1/size85045/5
MVTAIGKLTQIAAQLAAQKKTEKTLENLLDGAGSAASSESGSSGGSRRYAAALRALRKAVVSQPKAIYSVLEKNMEEDFNIQTMMPGSSPVQVSARAWWRSGSSRKISEFGTSLYVAIGVFDLAPTAFISRCGLLPTIAKRRRRALYCYIKRDREGEENLRQDAHEVLSVGMCSLQPLQAKAISASSEVCARLSSICVLNMAVLFVLVLLAVAKNGDGMRAPPQSPETENWFETWWGKDPCAQFGAKKKSWWSNTCQCPKDLPIPSRNCEGRDGRSFDLKETIEEGSNCRCEEDPCEEFGAKRNEYDEDFCTCPSDRPVTTKECGRGHGSGQFFLLSQATAGCRCVTEVGAARRLSKIPVAASALRFCEALVGQSYKFEEAKVGRGLGGVFAIKDDINRALEKTSPEICQHALVGTITPTEANRAPFAEKASELSQKGSDGDPDRGYGRMRSVKEDATGSTEKALWKHALARVCKDECEDLLNMTKKEADHLAIDVLDHHTPFAQTCAERVVQHVEAEILGCCARSCGFDGRRCLLWPFFSPEEKVDWQLECCAEMNVLKNSSRELMCNSVLPDRLAKKASNFDLEEQSGTDVGKVLIGQNASLVWTKEGAQESALGKEVQAHDGDKVSMDFLIKHQKIGEEYLHLGYFRKQPLSKMLNEATSMMEVSSQDDTCNFGHFKEQCPKKFMTTFVEKCNEAWNVAENFRRLLTHPAIGDCDESDSQNFSTPEECERLEVNSFGTVFLHYFEYNKDNKDLPIKCFSVAVSNEIKKQCKGKDDWWESIRSVSVQQLMKDMNGRDVNDYAQLVYIKSMKTN